MNQLRRVKITKKHFITVLLLDKIIKKLNKLSLPTVILIASLIIGGFYYASEVNKQRSIERQQQIKIEQEKQDQLTKELKEQETKKEAGQALTTCIDNAKENYINDWYGNCKGRGKLADKCISLYDMTFDEYAKQNNIPSAKENPGKSFEAETAFYKEMGECSCPLSIDLSDRIEKTLQDNKDECFRKYPQK